MPSSPVSLPPLLDAYLNAFDRVAPFYLHNIRDPEIWPRMMRRVDERADRPPRRTLASILRKQNRAFGADEQTFYHIEDLAQDGVYAVMTGQQVGLFNGFLFTVYKAITAVRLAAWLAAHTGRRVVPVFWMASDDHDFHEINHVYACNQDNEVLKLELTPDMSPDRRSAAHIPFGRGIVELIDAFVSTLPASEFKPDVVKTLREACTPDASFALGFARLLTRLFKGRGLVLVDPTDPALKPLMRPVFEQEIRHPLATTRHITEAGKRLAGLGFDPQISRPPDAVNLFLYHDGARMPVSYEDGRFYLGDTGVTYDQASLLEMIEKAPEAFSQNVVTRPVLQDTLFPTLAYVGGPSEVAYFAQFKEVYAHFGIPYPVVYPRASLTLVERRIERILEKYALQVEDFFGDVYQVLGQRMRDELPDELLSGFAQAREAIEAHYRRLVPQIAEIEPTLEKTAESAQRKTVFELEKLEEKTVQAFRRAHKTMQQQIEKANSQLYPRHQLQERTLNIWSYIALYGFAFMDTLFEVVDEQAFGHRVVPV